MHLMCNVDASGKRVYTLNKVLEGKVTKSAHPARFSPDDKWSKHRNLLRKRFGRLPGVKGMSCRKNTKPQILERPCHGGKTLFGLTYAKQWTLSRGLKRCLPTCILKMCHLDALVRKIHAIVNMDEIGGLRLEYDYLAAHNTQDHSNGGIDVEPRSNSESFMALGKKTQ